MTIKKLMAFALILLPTMGLMADSIGEIIYFEGEVSIQRDQDVLTEYDLDFGYGVENYDLISTGPDSYLEMELFDSTGISGVIRMDPSSTFYLEVSDLRTQQTGNVELLAGRLNFDIQHMSNGSGFQVRTESAVMGVRGTQFDVITAPQGEILISTSEGRVEVEDSSGSVNYSEPGQVVEASDDKFVAIPVSVETLEGYMQNWYAEKVSAFRANAPRAISNFARRFEQLRGQFDRAFAQMDEVREILDKWKMEDRRGTTGGRMEQLREKREVVRALLAVRRAVFMFERVFYRLAELKSYVDEDGITGEVRPGYSISAFYRDFTRDSTSIQRRLAEYYYVLKLYSLRNEGRNPIDEISGGNDVFGSSENDFGSDDGFDSTDDFF